MNNNILKALAGGLLLALSLTARGHALWDPDGLIKPRSNRDDIKTGPCGVPRTSSTVTLAAGSTVNLEIERTIYHQGYFRIAFSPANDQGFDNNILVARFPETSAQRNYSISVTLPNVECETCTLQLIQVMLDRNPPTNYYSCADIRLVRTTQPDTQPPGSVGQVLAVPGGGNVQLSWTNPSDADFAGVMITERTTGTKPTPAAGQEYGVGDNLGTSRVVFWGNGVSAALSGHNTGTYQYTLFSFDQSHNYDSGVNTQVTLTDLPNLSPRVSLVAEQNQRTVTRNIEQQGRVTVQAQVSDANSDESHSLIWTVSDNRVVDLESTDGQFTFDPASLPTGDYRINVQVTDSGQPPLSGTAEIILTLANEGSPRGGANAAWLLILLVVLLPLRRGQSY
jgi:hypothetical protein